MIPFKPDRLAAGADPVKTYEYLAMGLPVVDADNALVGALNRHDLLKAGVV